MAGTLDPRTPVLVGVAAVTQREDDPVVALDALGLMTRAAREAADDAGAPGLVDDIRWIGVPDGLWSYADPGRALAARLGCDGAHTVLAEVGVLQHALWVRAAELIATGSLDAALVVGGEARYRDRLALAAGMTDDPLDDDARDDDVLDDDAAGGRGGQGEPDERWSTSDVGISDHEMVRGLHHAPSAYALIEQAVGRAAGRSDAEHLAAVGDLWARFARTAAANPLAWDRSAPDAAAIITPSAHNRMASTPYTRLLCSQWTVDQAAALLLCSVEVARRHHVPEDRWVFPLASACNTRPVPVSRRRDPSRLPGAEIAGRALFQWSGYGPDDIGHVDLYSCFPVAVEVYARELGLGLERDLTITGGMTFGGGPFNNYVLQSTAQLAGVLRVEPGSIGLTSLVSGFLSKQGLDLWSTSPPTTPFRCLDVTDEVERVADPAPEATDHVGPVTVVGATVRHERGEPWEVLAVCEAEGGGRLLASSSDPDVMGQLGGDPWPPDGWSVDVDGRLRRDP